MKILNWNCDGGFFTKGKYKSILKYDADIMIIQECSDPEKSINDDYEKGNPHYKKVEVKYFIELYPNPKWLSDYKICEIKMDDKDKEKKHKDKLGQEGIAIFAKKDLFLERNNFFVNKCGEKITWWSEKKDKETMKKVSIIENNSINY
jgi:hypothetical protein